MEFYVSFVKHLFQFIPSKYAGTFSLLRDYTRDTSKIRLYLKI